MQEKGARVLKSVSNSTSKCHKGSNHRKATHPVSSVSWIKITSSPDPPLVNGTIMLVQLVTPRMVEIIR